MSKLSSDSIEREWATGPDDPLRRTGTTDGPHPAWEAHQVPPLPDSDQPGESRPTQPNPGPSGQIETYLFRFVLLFVGIQLLPIDGTFLRNLPKFSAGYTRYLFNLSKFSPRFVGGADSFANWGIVALLAGIGAVLWDSAGSPYRR